MFDWWDADAVGMTLILAALGALVAWACTLPSGEDVEPPPSPKKPKSDKPEGPGII